MTSARFYGLLVAAAGVLGLIVALIILHSRLDLRTVERDLARAEAAAQAQAHAQTVINYRAASEQALADARRDVARVAAEQAAITERTQHDYQDRLASVDARLVRARAEIAARTDLGSADPAPVSLARDATCHAYAGTDCDGLLAKLATAERQAWNLIELRNWVAAQAAVTVKPDEVVK